MPGTVTYGQLRAGLDAVLDQVCEAHDPVYVASPGGANVVILSREDYEALQRTAGAPESSSSYGRTRSTTSRRPSAANATTS